MKVLLQQLCNSKYHHWIWCYILIYLVASLDKCVSASGTLMTGVVGRWDAWRNQAQLPGIKQWPLHNESRRQHIRLLQGCARFAYSYIFSFAPPPCFLPLFLSRLSAWLTRWGSGKINKYMYREAHDLSRCRRNMAPCWHLVTSRLCVCVCVFKHQEIMFGSVKMNTAWTGKIWQGSGL